MAGGQAEKEVINMAEIYSPTLNQWEQLVARMAFPRLGLATVSMGNKIYVIGESSCCLLLPIHHHVYILASLSMFLYTCRWFQWI